MKEIGPETELPHAAGMYEYKKERILKSADKIGQIIEFPRNKKRFKLKLTSQFKPKTA